MDQLSRRLHHHAPLGPLERRFFSPAGARLNAAAGARLAAWCSALAGVGMSPTPRQESPTAERVGVRLTLHHPKLDHAAHNRPIQEATMNKPQPAGQSFRRQALAGALSVLFFASGVVLAADVKVTLSGDQEVPPVKTEASGSGTITINADKTVSGKVATKGITAVAAHIHAGEMGKNGPVAVPLAKEGDGQWAVPAGAKLTDAQYADFQKGGLYVNVHSAAHPDGEIRGQLKP
jgi:hypothetical protein